MAAAALALAAVAALALPPAPARRVEDRAALLTTANRAALDAKLTGYERATGHQIVVWIDRTHGDAPLDQWAVETFAEWKLGRAGVDDGLAIFVFADDRELAIEVGYGLEDRVPDAVAARVIREVMTPPLQSGDPDTAVAAGVDAVLAAIEGRPWVSPPHPSGDEPPPLPWAIYAIAAAIALVFFIKYPRAALWLFWSMASSGRWRGGGSGGGFHGGGGRSGGGGARGKW